MQNKNQNQTGSPDDLNHPGREFWMDYLYNEVSRKEKAALAAHLEACSKCRADVESWQATMGMLDAAKAQTDPARSRMPQQPWLKWGIAAAIAVLLSFVAGRASSSNHGQINALRTSLKSELRIELLAELRQEQQAQLASFKLDLDEKRANDRKSIYHAIDNLDTAHQTDYASLRKELETVALLTQDGLQQAQQQMFTLASSQGDNRNQTP